MLQAPRPPLRNQLHMLFHVHIEQPRVDNIRERRSISLKSSSLIPNHFAGGFIWRRVYIMLWNSITGGLKIFGFWQTYIVAVGMTVIVVFPKLYLALLEDRCSFIHPNSSGILDE